MKYYFVDVPACNMQAIEKIIARLIKKGVKAQLDVTREAVKNVPIMAMDSRHVVNTHQTITANVVDFVLDIDNVELRHWELLGTKERVGKDAIYKGNIPAEYKNSDFACEHCSTNRRRNKVAIIRHKETAELKQVGYTCLQDFIGCELGAFGALIKGIDAIYLQVNYFGDCEYTSNNYYYNVNQFLQIAYNCIVKYGYVKNNSVTEMTTTEHILEAYRAENSDYVDPAKVDTDLVNKIKNAYDIWAKSHPSDFTHNVCTILEQTCVKRIYANYMYFIPTFYVNKVRWDARKARAEQAKKELKNEYAGAVGDKITTEATIECVTGFDGYYGYMYVYNFKDVHGHMLVWFTGKDLEVNTGNKIRISGTIKKLNEYKGIKQTVLTRCKVK